MAFLETPKKVLHFAPEACLYGLIRKAPLISYTTADLMVSFMHGICVKPDIKMSVMDIQSTDNVFDVVICIHVLEHVHDDGQAMREILRVLRPGGYAILNVPIDQTLAETDEDPTLGPEERAKRYGYADHLRLYGRDYADRLSASGFRVNPSRYGETVDAKRYGIDRSEIIYVCYKPE
jgi:SAM-dependent methyltransferase